MKETKKARSTVGAAEQAAGNGRADTSSCKDFNAVGGNSQQQIVDLLLEGSANSISRGDLVRLTGMNDRQVRRQINSERLAGHLILSNNRSGYFRPSSEDDVRQFIRSMSRRAREITAVCKAAEDALARMTGQEQIWGW